MSFLLICLLSFVGCRDNSEFHTQFSYFVGILDFSGFAPLENETPREVILLSPEIATPILWNELIVSWNVDAPPRTYVKIEARAILADGPTKFYTMGLWSENPNDFPRESVPGQGDSKGNVRTDILALHEPSSKAQLRIILGSSQDDIRPTLKFIGVSFSNTHRQSPPLPDSKSIAGHELNVVERSQDSYPGGFALCSPTSVSMVLNYWSKRLNQPDLDFNVQDIAEAVYDPVIEGTGNWSFNTAFAGRFPGMRGVCHSAK